MAPSNVIDVLEHEALNDGLTEWHRAAWRGYPAGDQRCARALAGGDRFSLMGTRSSLLDAWEHADSAQRARLMAGIYERVEVEAPASGERPVDVIAIPRPDWAPFFRQLANGVSLERVCRFG